MNNQQEASDLVMALAIKHWQDTFSGIDGIEISQKLEMSHDVVMAIVKELVNRDLGTANYMTLTVFTMTPQETPSGTCFHQTETQVPSCIFFPNRALLGEVFEREGKDYGPFSNRLLRGESQVHQHYFGIEVLAKYRRRTERYRFEEDPLGGHISRRDEYVQMLPEGERDKEKLGFLRFGKRLLRRDTYAVAVIAYDLSQMSREEQHFWEGHLLHNPEFADGDVEYEAYYRQNFDAEFVAVDDPLGAIPHVLDQANVAIGKRLFRHAGLQPRFSYPQINTRQAYCVAHKELFKLIGPDGIECDVLRELATGRFGLSPQDLHQDSDPSQKPLGKWGLFKKLLERVPGIDMVPFRRCKEARTEDAHRLPAEDTSDTDWIPVFRQECTGISAGLRRFVETIRS